MGVLNMSDLDRLKLSLLKGYQDNKYTIDEISSRLNLSTKQIRRLLIRLKSEEISDFTNGLFSELLPDLLLT